MVETLRRLPVNNEAIADPVVTGDPFLAGSAAAVQSRHPAAHQPRDALRLRLHDRRRPGPVRER